VSVAEEYGGLLTDHGLLGLMDANLRNRLTALYDTSIDITERDSLVGDWTARRISPLDLQNAGRRAILTGSPGSGKTTLLKFLALQAVLKQAEDFVLFLELKSVTVNDLKNFNSLADLLFAKAVASRLHLSDWEQHILKAEFLAQLNAGRAWLYLDGLDEVRHQTIFDDLCRLVSEFAMDHRYNGATLLVSARPFALHRASLERLPLMEIQPLERNQITDFLHAYYPDEKFTDNLIADLNKPGDLQELARVPAMLASLQVCLNLL
jgi:predicted NACHT family NTPase